MTEEQFENCKQCLNRKRGVNEKENICNLKGKSMDFEGSCKDFDPDTQVVLKADDKIHAIRPNLKRAQLAQLFILLVMALDLVSIFSSYLQYNLLISLQNNEDVTDQMLIANDSREQIIAILYLIVFIISGVTFIQWFRRAYYNLNIRANCNHSNGWAAGSWFVPIISLYRPYQIMKEMWNETSAQIKSKSPNYIEKSTIIIGIWWTLWIFSNYIGSYILKASFKTESISGFINTTIADIIISVIGIPLAIATVIIIKTYSKKEEKILELERIEA